MTISQRALDTAPSPTLGITAKANALKAQGIDVIGFAAGEPDFDTPDSIKQAAIDALNAGYTKYTPSSGAPDLKKAIVEKFARENALHYKPEQVIVSCGAKHSLYTLFQALLNPGDEVIIPAPYWVTYPEQVRLAEGKSVIVETRPENDFMPTHEDVRAAITPRTRALVLNSPNNPTGGVAARQTVKELASLAIKHNFVIVSDEIYEHLLYDGRTHVCPAALGEEAFKHTVTINGCSKAYSMTGWRIGYAASADTELISAMGRLQDQSTSNPASISQKAAVAALSGSQEPVETMRRAFEERRNLIVDLLNGIPGIACRTPGGAFYAFADASGLVGRRNGAKTIANGDDLATYLLDAYNVAVVPGSGFGAPNYIRLSYATSNASIERGLERIREAVCRLE